MIVEVVFDCVSIPLSVEVIVVVLGLEPYPYIMRLIVVWLSAHPSMCRGDSCCALPLMKRLYLLERGVVFSYFVLPKSSVELPCVGSPV